MSRKPGDTSRVTRFALWLAIATVGTATIAASAAGPATSAPRRTQTVSLIVHGYPYAAQCPAAGFADVVDRFEMYACNCTSYVAWALVANHQRIDWFVPGAMNAWNWPNVARRGSLRVDRVPAPGAVVVWPRLARPYGHVAYVIGVHSNGTIDVAEYNYPGLSDENTYVFDIRRFIEPAGALFIHVPRAGPRSSSPPSSPHR
jgi:surface antigen